MMTRDHATIESALHGVYAVNVNVRDEDPWDSLHGVPAATI